MAIDPIISDGSEPSPPALSGVIAAGTTSAANPSPVLSAGVATGSNPAAVAANGSVASPSNPSNAIAPLAVPQITVAIMQVSGTVTPDMNGDYYPAGTDENGKMRYTLDGVAYATNVSRIESNGMQWLIISVDVGGDTNGIWASNDSPHPTTPATSETWTPDGVEDGNPVVIAGTATISNWHVDAAKSPAAVGSPANPAIALPVVGSSAGANPAAVIAAGNNPPSSNPSPII